MKYKVKIYPPTPPFPQLSSTKLIQAPTKINQAKHNLSCAEFLDQDLSVWLWLWMGVYFQSIPFVSLNLVYILSFSFSCRLELAKKFVWWWVCKPILAFYFGLTVIH